jgi:hypothetical protein
MVSNEIMSRADKSRTYKHFHKWTEDALLRPFGVFRRRDDKKEKIRNFSGIQHTERLPWWNHDGQARILLVNTGTEKRGGGGKRVLCVVCCVLCDAAVLP